MRTAPDHPTRRQRPEWPTRPDNQAATPQAERIARLWPQLPPHVREAITTLVDAAVERHR